MANIKLKSPTTVNKSKRKKSKNKKNKFNKDKNEKKTGRDDAGPGGPLESTQEVTRTIDSVNSKKFNRQKSLKKKRNERKSKQKGNQKKQTGGQGAQENEERLSNDNTYPNIIDLGEEEMKNFKEGKTVGTVINVQRKRSVEFEDEDRPPIKKSKTIIVNASAPNMKEDTKTKPKKKKKQKVKLMNNELHESEVISQVDNTVEKELPDMSAWLNLFVPDPVLKALAEDGFTSPTPIQAKVLPSAIRDRMDIVGAAQTGSGKTLAFGIPLVNHILKLKQDFEENDDVEDTDPESTKAEDGELLSDTDDEENKVNLASEDGEAGDKNENSGSEESDDDIIHSESEDSDNDIENLEDEKHSDENTQSSDEENSDMEESDEGCVIESYPGAIEELDLADLPLSGFDKAATGKNDDDDFDLPPSEEDVVDEGQMGCVRVESDVTFPWLKKKEKPKQIIPKKKPKKDSPLYALVLTPTRELAIQVKDHIKSAARYTDIQMAVVVGGMAAQKQERLLKKCPEIVIGTPGRLWELFQQGDNHLSKINTIRFLVIDEADRMIEKGHFQEMTSILGHINSEPENRKKRQTFVFSATLTFVHGGPDRFIMKKKKKYQKITEKEKVDTLVDQIGLKDKKKIIDLSGKQGIADTLTEARITCTMEEKDLYLYYFTQQYPGRTLVFVNSIDCLRRLVTVFTLLQCCPLPLHAEMHQKQRLKNLERFKGNAKGLLIATDVAARGLDIPNVEHVIHFQIPRTTENYIHRSGRTARASKEGLSVMLISPDDMKNYRQIIKTLNRNEELSSFPVENDYLPGLKSRVSLARAIDKEEHQSIRQKVQNNWFVRAAKEMDIDLDERMLHEEKDSFDKANFKRKIDSMKMELKMMIKQPVVSRTFSGRYLTKYGKLVLPYSVDDSTGALNKVKKDKTKTKEIVESVEANKQKKKTKFERFKKLRQKRKAEKAAQ